MSGEKTIQTETEATKMTANPNIVRTYARSSAIRGFSDECAPAGHGRRVCVPGGTHPSTQAAMRMGFPVLNECAALSLTVAGEVVS